MADHKIFVSVGGTAHAKQEDFVRAVEDRLRAEGLEPRTVGRNTFSADAPLKAVRTLMDECSGAVVIAFERTYFPSGIERRGGDKHSDLSETLFPTPWNQIEAAMAYSRDLPLLVIVEEGLRAEGLLERGYDWYVQTVKLEAAALSTPEFNGVLGSWKDKIQRPSQKHSRKASPAELTLSELIGGLKPTQLWSLLGTLAALLAGAFALGSKLFGS